MRRELNQVLKKEFVRQLKEKAPQFKRIKIKDLPPGQTAFCWALPNVHFYLVIVPHTKFDEFNIEIGWSKKKVYPYFISPPPFHPTQVELLFRLVEFTWNHSGGEPWWVLADPPDDLMGYFDEPPPLSEAIEKIGPCLDEVMDVIESHAMPLFRKVAELPVNN